MVVVEMTRHEVVRMIAMRNSFVPAARAMTVSGFVTGAGVPISAFLRIAGIHFQCVFLDMIALHVVHMAIVKEALVPLVHDGRVAAVPTMLMRVSFVNFVTHGLILLGGAMLDVSHWSRENSGRRCWAHPV
jgi:hypothetical protein